MIPCPTRTQREAIRASLVQQVAGAFLCLLLLDGGRMARVCAATILGYWAGAAMILARSPEKPARGHRAYLRWGFPAMFVAAAAWAFGVA